jgi:hypothetical protein
MAENLISEVEHYILEEYSRRKRKLRAKSAMGALGWTVWMSTLKRDWSMTGTSKCGDAQSVVARPRHANALINQQGSIFRQKHLSFIEETNSNSERALKMGFLGFRG